MYEGTGEVPVPRPTDSPHKPAPPITVRLHRVRAVVDCLGDSLTLTGQEYSSHICDRAEVCEFVSDELRSITSDLEKEGTL